MFNLEGKTYVIMGIANKRSIGFGVAKVLDELGANLVFTYRKERSKDQLVKLFEELKIKMDNIFMSVMFKRRSCCKCF